MGWLDSRGHRELKLKKELDVQREVIIKHMENRAAYLKPREPTPEEDDQSPQPRMATRTKTNTSNNKHLRCLAWRNTTAVKELGHRHVDPPPKPRPRGKKVVVYEDHSKPSQALPPVLNRQGKPVSRQGGRYNF
jgi:hypothetical protein